MPIKGGYKTNCPLIAVFTSQTKMNVAGMSVKDLLAIQWSIEEVVTHDDNLHVIMQVIVVGTSVARPFRVRVAQR